MQTHKPQGYRLPGPTAEPGCATCLSLVLARQNARSGGDYSSASDRNVDLRAHHATAH